MLQILVYFLCKNCTPSWKRSPPLSQQPPPKLRSCQASPLFENLVGGLTRASSPTPQQKKGGVHYVVIRTAKQRTINTQEKFHYTSRLWRVLKSQTEHWKFWTCGWTSGWTNVEHWKFWTCGENVVEQMFNTENFEHVVEHLVEQMLNIENFEHVVKMWLNKCWTLQILNMWLKM